MSGDNHNQAGETRRYARSLPHVRCRRPEAHAGHKHVNEGRPRGGCGMPEWCDGGEVSS